eukprot:m.21874 g.21874  ORF g.21874 m.21874 type:complete len:100 (+) comp11173_c0_seq1:1729-2028(+)
MASAAQLKALKEQRKSTSAAAPSSNSFKNTDTWARVKAANRARIEGFFEAGPVTMVTAAPNSPEPTRATVPEPQEVPRRASVVLGQGYTSNDLANLFSS